MTERFDLLNQLQSDLSGKFKRSNLAGGYRFDLDNSRVIVASPDTVDIKHFPAVSIYVDSDPISGGGKNKDLTGSFSRSLSVILTGYVKASSWMDILKFSHDIEKFLFSDDFGGDYIDEISIYLDPQGPRFYSNKTMLAAGLACFDLRFNIQYTQNL